MENKKWKIRSDMLGHYINNVSSKTFQDAENRLNYLENVLPDMREKVKEYISELNQEIDRCTFWIEEHMDSEACQVTAMEMRVKTLGEVVNDLEGRLEELV